MREHVLRFSGGKNLLICSVDFFRRSARLGIDVSPVIDEGADGNAIDQLRDATAVVIVIMGQQDIIDLADAGTLGCSKNPVRIAATIFRPAGVDEQRLSRWGNEEGRLAALHIDEINLKIAFSGPNPRFNYQQ